MVKTLLSNAGGTGSTLGPGANIPCASWSKKQKQNRSHIVINSIKTLKMAHISKHVYYLG